MPPVINTHASDTVGLRCASSCGALKARLAKLNCKEALGESSSYLAGNQQIVANFPEELRKRRDAVIVFAAGVEHVMRIARDCLVKEKTPSRALMDAYLGVNEFRDYVVNWINDKPRVPRELEKDFQARLLRSHAKAVTALAVGSKAP